MKIKTTVYACRVCSNALNMCVQSVRMDMVHLPGKGVGGRRVPVVITPEVSSAMKVLVDTRDRCGIPPTNQFFFATPSSNGCINGWQVMNRVATAAALDKPELIQSTRIRKYMATVIQVG